MTLGPIRFTLDARRSASRRLLVGLELELDTDPDRDTPLELFLPVWTPGSYLVREYARHISSFEASAPWEKTAKNRYRIHAPAGTRSLQIHYTVYAHELSVRTAHATSDHAMWNGACVFLWPLDPDTGKPLTAGAEIRVQLPEGWQLHTQLATSVDPRTGDVILTADSLDDLVDSPCLAGRPVVLDLEVLGVPHSLVLDGLGGIQPPESLVADTRKIVEAAASVFASETLPYDRYQFLCMFTDHGRGGLEHRSSSLLLAPRTTFHSPKHYQDFMGLIAHEHFHVFNVKRMRPKELWHYDYENENYTRLLWVAEGFTAYYDDHLCLRAGVLTPTDYLKIIARHIANMRRGPGRLDQPLADASFDAWIRLYRPDENTRNVTQSYYGNGALVGMLLDLKIRELTAGSRSLDGAMAALYRNTYLEDRGYTEDDVIACLSEAAGADLSEMVQDLVHGPFDPDFQAALGPFGLEIIEKTQEHNAKGDPDSPTPDCHLGVQFKSGSAKIASVTLDSPADDAGLAPGDEVLALNNLRVRSGSWDEVFGTQARRDQPMTVLISRSGVVQEVQVTPGPPPPGGVKIRPREDSTPEQQALRRAWLFEAE